MTFVQEEGGVNVVVKGPITVRGLCSAEADMIGEHIKTERRNCHRWLTGLCNGTLRRHMERRKIEASSDS